MNETPTKPADSDDVLEAHLRRTLTAVAGSLAEADLRTPSIPDTVVQSEPTVTTMAKRRNGRRPVQAIPLKAGPRRAGLLAAVAALLLIALVGVATIGNGEVHPAASLADGTWSPMEQGPLSSRFAPSVEWSGSEMIVFGGFDRSGTPLSDGAAYDPASDKWRLIAPFPGKLGDGNPVLDEYQVGSATFMTGTPPESLQPNFSAFVGEEFLTIVKKASSESRALNWDLVAYNPNTDSWRTLDQNRYSENANDEIVADSGSATVHLVRSTTAWRNKLVVFGWRSDLGRSGWASYDPAQDEWSDFVPVEGIAELDQSVFGTGGASLVDDRYLVVISDIALLKDPPAGVIVDLVSKSIKPIPNVHVANESITLWTSTINGKAAVGIKVTETSDAERVAYTIDPATAKLTAASAPRSGSTDDGPATLTAIPGGHMLLGGLSMPGRSGGLRAESVVLVTDSELTRWVSAPEPPIDMNRTGHEGVWTGTELIVWGGATTDPTPGAPINVASVPLTDGAVFTPGS